MIPTLNLISAILFLICALTATVPLAASMYGMAAGLMFLSFIINMIPK